jgi:hypothetical protein
MTEGVVTIPNSVIAIVPRICTPLADLESTVRRAKAARMELLGGNGTPWTLQGTVRRGQHDTTGTLGAIYCVCPVGVS